MADPEGTKAGSSDLNKSLIDFYSSQSEVVLSQYKNIEQLLLGKTHDWLWPGTHCEVLIRDFIRRNVLGYMRVDKGFIFGRTERRGENKHCPEVDILIHNIDKCPPMFRLEDFAIVQASAVLAMIQVKRNLNHVKCRKGIQNVAEAKLHAVKMLCRTMPTVTMNDVFPFHTAVIAIEDCLGNHEKEFGERIKGLLTDVARLYPPLPVRRRDPTAVSFLPNFIGSLSGHFAMLHPHCGAERATYLVMKSDQNGRNVALQALLASLAEKIFPLGGPKPVFHFPEMTQLGFVVEQPVAVIDD